LTEDKYFDEEVSGALGKNANTVQAKEEIDPLDAYMLGLEKEILKEIVAPLPKV
jgi:hypothetical protein